MSVTREAAFFDCIMDGRIEDLLLLHMRNSDLDLNAKTRAGFTALHLISRNEAKPAEASVIYDMKWGAQNMAFELLRLGASVDLVDGVEGRTALHWATMHGNIHLIELLLHYKADIAAQDKNGNTALHLVAKTGNVVTLALLLDYAFRKSPVLLETRNKAKKTFNELFTRSLQVRIFKRFRVIHKLCDSRLQADNAALLIKDLERDAKRKDWSVFHALIIMNDHVLLKQTKAIVVRTYELHSNVASLPSKIPVESRKYIPEFSSVRYRDRFTYFKTSTADPSSFVAFLRGNKNWASYASSNRIFGTALCNGCSLFYYACMMTNDSFVKLLLEHYNGFRSKSPLQCPIAILRRYRPALLPLAESKIPYLTYSIENDLQLEEACSICREPTVMGDEWIQLKCSHHFHLFCLRDWFQIQNSCPMCRKYVDGVFI
jgi:hypothetical protein